MRDEVGEVCEPSEILLLDGEEEGVAGNESLTTWWGGKRWRMFLMKDCILEIIAW